ncbi:carbonic anhydrase [Elysia marginata]|uniref:Carbonic anhydrase n=1 Tax=Elysia marginata TaxID=1093978 RepID=A0AAV4FV91_9GAST|nr:carbonic anhydrase [Elysia marginata]
MSISAGGFSDTYNVAQFHFHWGASSRVGSEHTINDKEYPMELHIVHYGQKHGALSQAAARPNGLAVLGFMFEISESDNPSLAPIVDKLSEVKYKGNATALATFSLRDIIPTSLTRFYRYSGSLTTPPCYESVAWTVFTSTIPISESQLQKFRQVMSSDKDAVTKAYKPLVNNYRPPQPINGRVVYANFRLDPDAATGVKASAVVCAVCFMVLLLL